MRPILFRFQWFEMEYKIGAYAFFLFLAVLWSLALGFWLLYQFLKKERPQLPNHKNSLSSLFFCILMILSGFIGARLLHVFLNISWYKESYKRIYSLDPTGFSIYGGILLCVLVGILISLKMKLNLWKLGDLSIPVFAGAAVLARLGCWFNGCCYGNPTDLPWGVSFAPGSPAFLYEMYHGYSPGQNLFQSFHLPLLHPSQLYEIVAILFALALYFLIKKRTVRSGTAALIFFIVYTCFRLFNNSLRVVPATFQASAQFYPIFYLVILFLLTGTYLFLTASSGSKEK